MFPSDMSRQRGDFARALLQWVVADDPDTLQEHLAQLGVDHRKYDVDPAHYEVAGEALIAAWRGRVGARWTTDHEQAIGASYNRLAAVMIGGALGVQAQPRYWAGEIVSHHRILDDFAVITIRPSTPYTFLAGQYATLELIDRRPRLWRAMSIASAPNATNTFDIHVRAVPGGDVSTALVMHARVGDRLRIGPPRGGALVVEPGTTSGLVCVAGGTGAAPICAVVESVLQWPVPPTVHAYVGVRHVDELYPVRAMHRYVGALPNVHVAGVVSDEPSYPGLRGRIPDIVPTLAPWASLGYDVLIAGPPRMTHETAAAFAAVGVPAGRIHFDAYELPVAAG